MSVHQGDMGENTMFNRKTSKHQKHNTQVLQVGLEIRISTAVSLQLQGFKS